MKLKWFKHQMPNWQTVGRWTILHIRKGNTENDVQNSNLICEKEKYKDNAQAQASYHMRHIAKPNILVNCV